MPAHPAFDAGRWFDAVATRRSRRAYEGPPSAEDLAGLASVAEAFTPFDDARVVLLPLAPAGLFTGIIGSYGRVTGPCAAFVFIADGTSETADAHCGYTGEGLVLEAHSRGLGTCWIAGSFSRATARDVVDLRPGEVVRAVSPVGIPLERLSSAERLLYGQARPKHRKPLDDIAPGNASWPAWAVAGVRAARVAPSAVNRQPWLFRDDVGSVVVSVHGAVPGLGRLDCGIAMLHFELGARSEGSDGAWEALTGDDVARWVSVYGARDGSRGEMNDERLEDGKLDGLAGDEDSIEEDFDNAFPLRTRVLFGVLAVIVAIGGLYLMLRVSSPTIGPGQTPPAGHYALPCPVCHSVSANAPAIGVR